MNSASQAWRRLVRFGFRLLYQEMAFTYDWVSVFVSLGQWRCWQRTALQFLPAADAGTVLELAHGTGDLQLDLYAAGYSSIGYDLSPQMGQIASRKLAQAKVPARLSRGDAQNLPFADESFSAIVSTFPTDFIIAPSTLKEAHRVLKTGGCIVVVLNGELTGNGAATRFLEWLYRITGQREANATDPMPFFVGYGFQVEVQEAACRGSRVQLVKLHK